MVSDLLLPCILAQGYYLAHEDSGKQVFTRNAPLWKGKVTEGPIELLVGYTYLPARTKVTFSWEGPVGTVFAPVNWPSYQAKVFYDYLNEWLWKAESKKIAGSEEAT